ncbi:MAG: hypothetical protein IT559_08095 [Alphaproteobacteria bacterium]|nr:hypothetical protein [Alphaproteobacteria bacterium]
MSFLLQWIDLIWLPLAFFVSQKHQRLWVMSFFISCMFMMRLQAELVESTGHPNGFLNITSIDVLTRGIMVYSLFYAIYLVLLLFSPYSKGVMLMAASLSLFFTALFTSMIVMVL